MNYAKSVEEFLSKNKEWENELIKLISLARSTKMEETIKWGIPVYTFQGKNIIGIGAFKSYVGIWFYQGALLKDTYKKLINDKEGITKALRQWRFSSVEDIDNELVTEYLNEAVQNHNLGKAIKPESKKAFEIPVELKEIFRQEPDLKLKFEKLSQFEQREYVEYINDAKRDATRLVRIDKVIPLIMEGLGLNDNYRK